jgi:hypothetical protein
METYSLLGPIESDITQLLNCTIHTEEFVWKGKTRLEDIGLRAFYLAGKECHSKSRHMGGEIDTIFYRPCKAVATQVRKPFRGCYVGSTTAIKFLENGMKAITEERTKPDYKLEVQMKKLKTNELVRFLEEFIPSDLIAFDFHIYDILGYFKVPYKKPNIDLFIEKTRQKDIEPEILDEVRISLKNEFRIKP